MSIAVSAVLVPSRVLRLAWLCYGAANLGAAAALGAAQGVDTALPASLAAAACLLAGVLVLRAAARNPKVSRIDISGLGQLRLTVQQGIGSSDVRTALVRLLPASTVWPGLLVLRLGGEDRLVRSLVLVPDSVEAEQFRRLAVAIRDVASRTV